MVRVAIALIVKTQKLSAKQSKREQETDQEVVEEMKYQGDIYM